MKITKTIFFAICFVLISISSVLANNPPAALPHPQNRSAGAAADNAGIPGPPGAPIDQNLIVLAGCAVLFGTYAIRRYNVIKKASI